MTTATPWTTAQVAWTVSSGTGKQELAVVQQLLKAPVPQGAIWTVTRLPEEVRRQTDVKISEGYLGRIIKKRGATLAAAAAFTDWAAGRAGHAAGASPSARA